LEIKQLFWGGNFSLLPFPDFLEIKQPQIATVDKRMRKDSFSQYSKLGKMVFSQFDHVTSYLCANANGKWEVNT
jgi:hypothetical protein